MTKGAVISFLVAQFGFLGLFGLLMLWHTVLFPHASFPIALMLMLTVTPLLLPMRGFLKGNLKNCAWMAYISLIYFIHGCSEAYADPNVRHYALLEVALSLMVFFGSTFYIRLMKITPTT